jgi:hypothetical protein
MADVTEITLGGLKYGIGRLTIGQLIEIGALQMTSGAPQATTAAEADDAFMRALGKRMIGTVSVAVSKIEPTLTPEKIGDLPMTLDELRTAYTAVLVHAGLVTADPKPGEAQGSP